MVTPTFTLAHLVLRSTNGHGQRRDVAKPGILAQFEGMFPSEHRTMTVVIKPTVPTTRRESKGIGTALPHVFMMTMYVSAPRIFVQSHALRVTKVTDLQRHVTSKT